MGIIKRQTGFQIAFSAILSLALGGCASTPTTDMSRVQNELSGRMQMTDSSIQQTQSDFAEKKSLYDRLTRANVRKFQAYEPKYRRHLDKMELRLKEILDHRRRLSTVNSEIVSLAYAHKKISSDSPEAERVEKTRTDFAQASAQVTSAILEYSRESNTLADEIANEKLFFSVDINEFQKRLQVNLKKAQTNLEIMQKEMNRAGEALNTATEPTAQEQVYAEMNETAQDYANRAQQFSQISQDMLGASLGNPRVSTLDSNWPGVESLIGKFDRLTNDLESKYQHFQADLERFRVPFKRAQ